MFDVPQEIQMILQDLERRLSELEFRSQEEDRKSIRLNDIYKDQQMQIDQIMVRIENDFPVAPWDD